MIESVEELKKSAAEKVLRFFFLLFFFLHSNYYIVHRFKLFFHLHLSCPLLAHMFWAIERLSSFTLFLLLHASSSMFVA
jgi:hypothetical protein